MTPSEVERTCQQIREAFEASRGVRHGLHYAVAMTTKALEAAQTTVREIAHFASVPSVRATQDGGMVLEWKEKPEKAHYESVMIDVSPHGFVEYDVWVCGEMEPGRAPIPARFVETFRFVDSRGSNE